MNTHGLSRWGRVIATIGIAATLAGGLAACSSSAPTTSAGGVSAACKGVFALKASDGPKVVLAEDDTLSAAVTASDPAVTQAVTAASRGRGTLSVLAVQGAGSKPDWVGQGLALNDPALASDTDRFARIVAMAPECANELAATARPHTAGTDLLTAMQLGAQELNGSGTLILHTDGMSNSGILDFSKQVYGSAPASIVAALSNLHQLPQFHGETVRISGIGAVAGAPLNQVVVKWFVSVFRAICTASGAKSCTVTSAIAQDASVRKDLPKDAALPLPTIPAPKVEGNACVYVLSNSVLFGGNSSVLSPAATSTLQAFVTQMKGTGAKVEVDGFTATFGSAAHDLALSDARATAVAQKLQALGFDSSLLSAKGKGGANPIASPDHNAQGEIESAAAKNRRVELRVTGLSTCG
jgi:outer membrane protein OmpA-like peptidoglycan-associated protein